MKFTEDESIILTDKSGNIMTFDTVGSNITVTAPETMTFNCKNMNINVGENMTTSVGMNKSDSIGMNHMESVGMLKNLSVGMDFMTNVVGKMVEFVKGNIESHTEEGRKMQGKEVDVNSETNINANASGNMKRNSGEKSNDY